MSSYVVLLTKCDSSSPVSLHQSCLCVTEHKPIKLKVHERSAVSSVATVPGCRHVVHVSESSP